MGHDLQRSQCFLIFAVMTGLCMMIAALMASCHEKHGEEGIEREEIVEGCNMVFKRIGVIRSTYTPEKGAPQQGKLAPDTESLIVIDGEYEKGLKDIETFSHIIVLYAFDRSSGWNPLVQTP